MLNFRSMRTLKNSNKYSARNVGEKQIYKILQQVKNSFIGF